MDYSATFARHFARLVALVRQNGADGAGIDEQKVALRALVALSRNGPVTLTVDDGRLLANDAVVPAPLAGVEDVTAQMLAHSIARIDFGLGSAAADLLASARAMARRAIEGDQGKRVTQKMAALGATTISFVTAADAAAEAEMASRPTVIVAMEPEQGTSAPRRLSVDVSTLSHQEILAELDASPTLETVERLLDDLVQVAEHSTRIGKAGVVADVVHGAVAREARLADAHTRRVYGIAIQRMTRAPIMRAVASLIAKKPQGKQHYYEVLERAGEDGAHALIDQITQARSPEARTAFLEVFVELSQRVDALKRMLSDSRWFVVRNAVDLLGEIGATQAEGELIALLKHPDERVRRSATNALLRLGTSAAMNAIYVAVSEASVQSRSQTTVEIPARGPGQRATALVRAIEEEQDVDVQFAMVAALGRIATDEAVEKLARIAEPEGRFFTKKKTLGLRLAAIEALGDARTAAARSALATLAGDDDADVRAAAGKLLGKR